MARRSLSRELMPWFEVLPMAVWESEVFPLVNGDVHPLLDRLRERASRSCRYRGVSVSTNIVPVSGGHLLRLAPTSLPAAQRPEPRKPMRPWRDIPPGGVWESEVFPPVFDAPNPLLDKLRTTVQGTNRTVKLPLTTRIVPVPGGHVLRVTHEAVSPIPRKPVQWPFYKLRFGEVWACCDRTQVSRAYDAAYRYNKTARRQVFSVRGSYDNNVLVSVEITKVCRY